MMERSIKTGFDAIGDAAIIKFPLDTKTAVKKRIALALMRENKHVTRVFEKIGKTEGEERVAKLGWLAGKKDSVVLHKENGCSFYVDIKKVYFSPRLGSERLRIRKMVKPRETVLDMFCGVGPYSIEIAKIAREVYAIDINKAATDLLKKNVLLNKLNNLKVINGDSKSAVKKLRSRFDRIIMNFPMGSKSFLRSALSVAADRCVIHYYFFANTSGGYKKRIREEVSSIKKLAGNRFSIRCHSRNTGDVAPYLSRTCLDLHLRKV